MYATKNLERLRALIRFCHQAGWIKVNPALSVKAPKVTQTPTLPFSRDEMKRIVAACDEYGGNRDRIKAFVLAMRYTGLRIGDTIRLSKSSIAGQFAAEFADRSQDCQMRSAVADRCVERNDV